jgi:cytolysin (calcineurin-like family phosphatase)
VHRSAIVVALLVSIAIVGLGYFVYPRFEARASLPGPALVPSLQPVAPRPRARRGGMDVTFLVTADTHFGFRVPAEPEVRGIDDVQGIEEQHVAAIREMNAIADKTFPKAVGGDRVGRPLGLLVAGDLTDDGKPREWRRFEQFYGLTGSDGLLRYPVFEGIGNHDKHYGWHVKEHVARRHGANRYSWDWHDLHLVCLGEGPDADDLAWLERDLSAVGNEVGIILYFHYPLEGPFSHGHWFGDGDHREALHRVISGRNVLGIFHGHYHREGTYEWHGFDVFNPGGPKHGGRSFTVVRVEDTRMTVASFNYAAKAWSWWRQKPIFGSAEKRIVSAAPLD